MYTSGTPNVIYYLYLYYYNSMTSTWVGVDFPDGDSPPSLTFSSSSSALGALSGSSGGLTITKGGSSYAG